MASYGLAKDIYKKNTNHDKEIIKKVVEEQKNSQGYEGLLKLVQGSDGQQSFSPLGPFSWKGLGEI
jgi:hypothetical protein